MDLMAGAIVEGRDARRRFRHAPRYAPAGQSTQMIVGADMSRAGMPPAQISVPVWLQVAGAVAFGAIVVAVFAEQHRIHSYA